MSEYFPRKPFLSEPILWWILLIFLILTGGVVAIVAVDAYRIAQQNKEFVFSGLPTTGENAKRRVQPLLYENSLWKVSFDVPVDHGVSERIVSEDDEVEIEVLKNTTEDVHTDTTVRVWIGKDTGFNRYLLKPYTTHAAYRRFTAVARRTISYADPDREVDGIQVVAIDDSRNGREIRVTYSALHEGAEALAFDILRTMRLIAREKEEDVLHKDGWKVFTHDPIRFQYPEDYSAQRNADGTVVVKGAGGSIEIEPILDILEAQTTARAFTGKTKGDDRIPDDFFDLRYDVTLRVKIFYAGEDAYQKSVLQDISRTITLKE